MSGSLFVQPILVGYCLEYSYCLEYNCFLDTHFSKVECIKSNALASEELMGFSDTLTTSISETHVMSTVSEPPRPVPFRLANSATALSPRTNSL